MWTRAEIKARAKVVLKVSYWKAFLVSLVIAIVGGGKSSPSFNWNFGNGNSHSFSGSSQQLGGEFFPLIFAGILMIVLIIIVVAVAFRVFLGYPLEVGGRRYFVQSAQNNIDMNYLGFSFSNGRYLNVVKTMFWRSLLNFLWFLLLIIPGIVKAYAYSMVPYILADNPHINYKRAVELSKEMTNGEKFDLWVLDLSFIGWYLLGTIALLIGVLFVMPYENATKAELYLILRQNALDRGLCSYEELMLNNQ